MGEEFEIPKEAGRRILATIVFTDIVGYSAHLSRDEAGTLPRVARDLERMASLCKKHAGRVNDTMGDGMMMIFDSAGVANILEGSMHRSGNRVRISAQLINARTDNHIWAENFDRDLTDVFTIQSEVAQEIAAALQANLTPAEKARIERKPTEVTKAYDLFLRARDFQLRPSSDREARREAEALYNQAIALDVIEQLLDLPGHVTPVSLRLDPKWNPLHQNPRFKALMEKPNPAEFL